MRRCRHCRTAALPERALLQLGRELYEAGTYAPSADGMSALLKPLRRLADRERMRLLGPLPPAARVIEVGAGKGRLIEELRAQGHDAVGLEPSRASSRKAIARGLPVEPVAIENADFPPGEADLIVLWHVLEHLDDPHTALGRVRRWLKVEGRLVAAVPNLESLQAWIGGDRWFHQDVPRHRTLFTPGGLDALLRRAGFAPTSTRHLVIEQNWLGMWLTLLNRLTVDRDVPFRFVKRDLRYATRRAGAWDALISMIAGIPLVPIAVTVELAAGLAHRGGTVVMQASPQ